MIDKEANATKEHHRWVIRGPTYIHRCVASIAGAYRETQRGDETEGRANLEKNKLFLLNPEQNVQMGGGAKDRPPPSVRP